MIKNVFCAEKPIRRYYHTKEEMELTRLGPLIDAKPCDADKPVNIFVHSAAVSSGKYFDRRQAVRKTWAKVAKDEYNISTYFAIAKNLNDSVNSEIQSEASNHSDIIQFSFIDDYYNLTLKNVALLRWVSRKCSHLKYILKTDDDVIVNINLLNQTLDQFKSGYTGYMTKHVPRADHDINFKNYIPKEYFPKEWIEYFMNGPAYLLSTDVIDKLLDTIDNYTGYVLDIDDFFITGYIAERAGVERHRDSRFMVYWGRDCPINHNNLCRMCSLIVLFECKDTANMVNFYQQWQQFDCNCTMYTSSFSLLWILMILFIIIFVIILVVVIWVVIFNKNKTP